MYIALKLVLVNVILSGKENTGGVVPAKDVSVPALNVGQPFGVLNGSYVNNDLITTGAQRNRVLVRFTNDTGATRTIRVGIFIGG